MNGPARDVIGEAKKGQTHSWRHTSSPRPPTVLLVDSDDDSRHLFGEYLRILEIHTIEIDNTADALALVHTADVIVTGLRVAGPFDGVELVRRLRADLRSHDKPIIVLTAWTLEVDRQRAYAAGCDRFLLKPCPPDVLLSEIRRVMTRRSPRPS